MGGIPTELILAFGGVLSAAVFKLWTWVDKRILDCESDRNVLHANVKEMNTELRTLSHTVGHMEGKLQEIQARNSIIDHDKKAK